MCFIRHLQLDSMAVKVSIYEDNASLLERLSYLIRGAGFELCSANINAEDIIKDCKLWSPDIILMGIDIPEMAGIEAIMKVKTVYPEINLIRFTDSENRDMIFDTLCAGATGYILKKTPSAKIIEAIEELYNGNSYICSAVMRKVTDFFAKPATGDKQDKYKLTRREREVLQRLMMGDSYKMIAEACFITIGTVYSHINNIYKKLKINSKSEAVVKALRERLV